ncbi:hypothetical protein AVEN_64603-1 [Araneus ventricosus]|uniref:Uncharacterized protein n=1 Tax=Araneus ventricosus TaxID=182803 RepID=A0A4Y2KI82_ARAVE|nr:hypothetical protein AVEN_64603-1 [Araneus ventricosus]
MPPKRRNIGLCTSAAKRKREERRNETEEETAQLNEGNRLYMSQSHSTGSSQQHEMTQVEKLVLQNCSKFDLQRRWRYLSYRTCCKFDSSLTSQILP